MAKNIKVSSPRLVELNLKIRPENWFSLLRTSVLRTNLLGDVYESGAAAVLRLTI